MPGGHETDLPPEARYTEDGKLFWHKKYVCSFLPRVHGIVETEADGEVRTFVRLSCTFPDGSESEAASFPLSGLKNIDWLSYDLRCQINQTSPRENAHRTRKGYRR